MRHTRPSGGRRATRRTRALPHRAARCALLVAAPDGQVYAHPDLDLVVDDGVAPRPAEPADLSPLPPGWELMQLPATRPLGFDRATGRIEVVDRCDLGGVTFEPRAVAVHPPPGFVRTHLPAARYLGEGWIAPTVRDPGEGRPGLPLWAYTAVGATGATHAAALFQADELSRWAPELYGTPDLTQRVAQRLRAEPDNRVLGQLARCALDYGCRCAQNIFYRRWEGALPTAPACNAACLGCLSKAPEWEAPVPQYRLRFTPTTAEISDVIVHHLERAPEPMISFGQGCEGEPTLNGGLLVEAIRQARARTARGVINLNSNGSRPKVVLDAVQAGVGAVRISVNSFDEAVFRAYFRPDGFGLNELIESLRLAHDAGAYTSINLLLWPGWTDRRAELDAVSALCDEGCLDMVQLRNLCLDPAHYQRVLPVERGQRLGLRGFVLELAARHPRLRFGTFNPRLAAPWYREVPPLPCSPLPAAAPRRRAPARGPRHG
ncbi:MAG: radical SAM protein [Deltaproteobacteria bacterium]|nr:radical SAM protein [Deltaproteobacteria bacterium]